MTSENDLIHALKNVPGFAGVYAADEIDQLYDLPPNRWFILNTNSRNDIGIGHWVACDSDGFFFDSFGQDISQIQTVMDKPYNESWVKLLDHYARRAGRKAHEYNHFDLQCFAKRGAGHAPSDLCGEYCVLFVKWGPVQDAQGRITLNWKRVTSIQGLCDSHENTVKRLSGVKR